MIWRCACLLAVDRGVLSEANRTTRSSQSFRISLCDQEVPQPMIRKVVCVHDNKGGGKGDPSTLFCHLTNQHAFMSQTLLEAERSYKGLKTRLLNGIVSSCSTSRSTTGIQSTRLISDTRLCFLFQAALRFLGPSQQLIGYDEISHENHNCSPVELLLVLWVKLMKRQISVSESTLTG